MDNFSRPNPAEDAPVQRFESGRDLYEQLQNMRSENFNLKLRLSLKDEAFQKYLKIHPSEDYTREQLTLAADENARLRVEMSDHVQLFEDAVVTLHDHEERLAAKERNKRHKSTQTRIALKQMELQVNALTEVQKEMTLLRQEVAERDEMISDCEKKINELAIKNSDLIDRIDDYNQESVMTMITPDLEDDEGAITDSKDTYQILKEFLTERDVAMRCQVNKYINVIMDLGRSLELSERQNDKLQIQIAKLVQSEDMEENLRSSIGRNIVLIKSCLASIDKITCTENLSETSSSSEDLSEIENSSSDPDDDALEPQTPPSSYNKFQEFISNWGRL